jgi:Ni/Co efflux regulator RcnB
MKRILSGIVAAGIAAVTLGSSAARADERPAYAAQYGNRDGRRVDDRRAQEQRVFERRRELDRERSRFYSARRSRWERARYDREYRRRCAELNRW